MFAGRGSHGGSAPVNRLIVLVFLLIAGCSVAPVRQVPETPAQASSRDEVVLYAMGLMGVNYRFGGKNPSSGMDCSGMVSYIYKHAVGMNLPHNAYRIAKISRRISMKEIRPGDLVFFNTQHRPYSHVGIYIGQGRFIHAPGTDGRIKISTLSSRYFARHLEGARTLF